jgi:iron complex outermembrane receptor protein
MTHAARRQSRLRYGVSALCFVALTAGSASAAEAIADDQAVEVAATATAGLDDFATVGEVVVTGTRTSTTEFKSLAPVQVIGAQALEDGGFPDLRSALSQIVTSYQNVTNNGSSASKPVRTATLRGLSGNHILVLVNGRRRHTTSLINNTSGPSVGASPVDLGYIPISAVKRIEVLTDGAAAQYGSDAIAGVINIILKSADEGGSASLEYGQYNHDRAKVGGRGDAGETVVFDINQGFKLGDKGGFLNVAATAFSVGDTNNVGPQKPPTAAAFQIYGAPGDPREATANRYRQSFEVVAPQEGIVASANAELPLSEGVTFYSDITAGKRDSRSFGTYRSETNAATIIGVSPAGGYVPVLETGEVDYQVNLGLRGEDLFGWHWDARLGFGRNEAKMHVLNSTASSFGFAAPHRDFFIGELVAEEAIAELDLTRSFNTGVFAEPLNVAVGVQGRYNSFEQKAGEYYSYANGGFIFPNDYPAVNLRGKPAGTGTPFMSGFSPSDAGDYNRNNTAFYVDLSQALTEKWNVGLAARYEDYSDFGDTLSGKLSTRYEFAEGYAIRATVNRGFRAPSLAEQYYTNANQGPQANPLVPGTFYQQNTYNSLRYNHPAAAALGASPLKPEESTGFSLGFAAQPTSKLKVTLDVFQIDIKDRIYLTGAFNGRTSTAIRNILQAAGVADPLVSVQYFTNIGETRTRGLDFRAEYSHTFDRLGDFTWSLGYSHAEHDVKKLAPVPTVLANAGLTLLQRTSLINLREGLPQDIIKGSVNWVIGPFDTTLLATYYGHTRQTNTAAPNDPRYDSVSSPKTIIDLTASYDITPKATLTLGVNNLFNVAADNIPDIAEPFITSGYTFPEPVRLTPYGTGGSFYYAKVAYKW